MFKFGGDYDATFPHSDHCDVPELLNLVGAVDPHRDSVDVLATRVTDRGYAVTALRKNQTSLGDV